MSNVIEKTGKTVEEAIQAAIEELGVTADDVDVEVLEVPSKRLFGLFGETPAKIRATLKKSTVTGESTIRAENSSDAVEKVLSSVKKVSSGEETATDEKSSVGKKLSSAVEKSASVEDTATAEKISSVVEKVSASVKEAASVEKSATVDEPTTVEESASVEKSAPVEETATSEEPATVEENIEPVLAPSPVDEAYEEEALDKAEAFLHDVFDAMNLKIEIEIFEIDDGFLFDLSGKGLGVLIGRHGQALDALQYLLNLAANRHDAENKIHFILDVEGYRDRRIDALEKLAHSMAERAIKTRRDVRLEPMNRHERKVIHTVLQDNNRVETHSAGTEPYRYVIITPTKRGGKR